MTYPHTAPLELPGRASERPDTLVSLLRRRASSAPDAPLYAFVGGDGKIAESLSAGELDRHARHVGALLQSLGAQASRTLILLPPGLEFAAAFFGCLYAGAIVVAAPLPVGASGEERTRRLIRDSGSSLILTCAPDRERLARAFEADGVSVLAPFAAADDLADDWAIPLLDSASLACLQYRSGPSGSGRGVMITHRNLLHNLRVTRAALALCETDSLVSWLAPSHEMGLTLGLLAPLHAGCASLLLDPAAVLARPAHWLEAVSRHRGTVTVAPNFGYDLCLRRIAETDRDGLDLSSLRLTLNGGEPAQARTLAEFSRSFAPQGFDPASLRSIYTLAEATLLVSGGDPQLPPVVGIFDESSLQQGIARVGQASTGRLLAGSGRPRPGQLVRIVDPASGRSCADGEIGEIWVGGPGVSPGFWRRRAETMESFGAFIRDTGEGPFVRSGDRGFLCAGELFLLGRAPTPRSPLPAPVDVHAAAPELLLSSRNPGYDR